MKIKLDNVYKLLHTISRIQEVLNWQILAIIIRNLVIILKFSHNKNYKQCYCQEAQALTFYNPSSLCRCLLQLISHCSHPQPDPCLTSHYTGSSQDTNSNFITLHVSIWGSQPDCKFLKGKDYAIYLFIPTEICSYG